MTHIILLVDVARLGQELSPTGVKRVTLEPERNCKGSPIRINSILSHWWRYQSTPDCI